MSGSGRSRVGRRKIMGSRSPKGIGMHELRPYYASLLIRHGESIKTVQRRLGHAAAAETLDTYLHLCPTPMIEHATRSTPCLVLACPGVPQRATRVIFTRVTGLGRTSWPVSRILCTGRLAASRPAVIHLDLPSPAGSSGLPAGIGRATLDRLRSTPETGVPLGLAPGVVYLAAPVTRDAGGLLHHRFTLTPLTRGGLFSVALSRGSPRVAVSNHPALRSPDFPRRARHRARRDRPASSSAPSA